MQVSDFDFELPEHLIAQHPLAKRSASKLLEVGDSQFTDRTIRDLPALLRPNDLLIFNNTRVMKARLFGKKATGGQVELLVERIIDAHRVQTHLKSSNKPAFGSKIMFDLGIEAEVMSRTDALFNLRFNRPADEVLEQLGMLPLPPYITHEANEQDAERYQTVFASQLGAAAAPTAGLHFDEALLNTIKAQGIEIGFVTLHVGAGTFQPVRTEQIKDHVMHSELYQIPQDTLDKIAHARACGGRVIAVGTTSLRTLEGAMAKRGQLHTDWDETNIFIYPGFEFKVVDALITNFHLPKSTLLMLVSAFAGTETIRQAYQYAIEHAYRFFSYGDAMWLNKSLHR